MSNKKGLKKCAELIEKNTGNLHSLNTFYTCLTISQKQAYDPVKNDVNYSSKEMEIITMAELSIQFREHLTQCHVADYIKHDLSYYKDSIIKALTYLVCHLHSCSNIKLLTQFNEYLTNKSKQQCALAVMTNLCVYFKSIEEEVSFELISEQIISIFLKQMFNSLELLKCINFLILNKQPQSQMRSLLDRTIKYISVNNYQLVVEALNIMRSIASTISKPLTQNVPISTIISKLEFYSQDRKVQVQLAAKQALSEWTKFLDQEQIQAQESASILINDLSSIAYVNVPYRQYLQQSRTKQRLQGTQSKIAIFTQKQQKKGIKNTEDQKEFLKRGRPMLNLTRLKSSQRDTSVELRKQMSQDRQNSVRNKDKFIGLSEEDENRRRDKALMMGTIKKQENKNQSEVDQVNQQFESQQNQINELEEEQKKVDQLENQNGETQQLNEQQQQQQDDTKNLEAMEIQADQVDHKVDLQLNKTSKTNEEVKQKIDELQNVPTQQLNEQQQKQQEDTKQIEAIEIQADQDNQQMESQQIKTNKTKLDELEEQHKVDAKQQQNNNIKLDEPTQIQNQEQLRSEEQQQDTKQEVIEQQTQQIQQYQNEAPILLETQSKNQSEQQDVKQATQQMVEQVNNLSQQSNHILVLEQQNHIQQSNYGVTTPELIIENKVQEMKSLNESSQLLQVPNQQIQSSNVGVSSMISMNLSQTDNFEDSLDEKYQKAEQRRVFGTSLVRQDEEIVISEEEVEEERLVMHRVELVGVDEKDLQNLPKVWSMKNSKKYQSLETNSQFQDLVLQSKGNGILQIDQERKEQLKEEEMEQQQEQKLLMEQQQNERTKQQSEVIPQTSSEYKQVKQPGIRSSQGQQQQLDKNELFESEDIQEQQKSIKEKVNNADTQTEIRIRKLIKPQVKKEEIKADQFDYWKQALGEFERGQINQAYQIVLDNCIIQLIIIMKIGDDMFVLRLMVMSGPKWDKLSQRNINRMIQQIEVAFTLLFYSQQNFATSDLLSQLGDKLQAQIVEFGLDEDVPIEDLYF